MSDNNKDIYKIEHRDQGEHLLNVQTAKNMDIQKITASKTLLAEKHSSSSN